MSSSVEARQEIPDRGLWIAVAVTSVLGLGVAAIQVADKIAMLENPANTLLCDVNAVLSCSAVLTHWQSSALGVPNAFVGAIFLALFGSAALGALLHSAPSRRYLATLWGAALFFLCFVTWYLEQNAFAIHALCLWCSVCATVVVIVTALLTRIAAHAHAFGSRGLGRTMELVVRSGADLVVFVGWWLALAAMLAVGLLL